MIHRKRKTSGPRSVCSVKKSWPINSTRPWNSEGSETRAYSTVPERSCTMNFTCRVVLARNWDTEPWPPPMSTTVALRSIELRIQSFLLLSSFIAFYCSPTNMRIFTCFFCISYTNTVCINTYGHINSLAMNVCDTRRAKRILFANDGAEFYALYVFTEYYHEADVEVVIHSVDSVAEGCLTWSSSDLWGRGLQRWSKKACVYDRYI